MPKPKYLDAIRRDPRSPVSAISIYLNDLRGMSSDGGVAAEKYTADLIETFSTPAGLNVLFLLEKAVLYAALPNGSPEGALRELNAQRNLVLEIRRLVANG